MKSRRVLVLVLAAMALVVTPAAVADPAGARGPKIKGPRAASPIVLTGAQLGTWSGPPAEGVPNPFPSGTTFSGIRDAHNGTILPVPQETLGVDVSEIVAFRWQANRFVEIPLQVDERFPYFLANANSDFADYSGTDKELTYAWDTESWKKTAGECFSQYPPGVGPMADPASGLDADDEVVFMADDAGKRAPAGSPSPPSTTGESHEVKVFDPLISSESFYVYLFIRPTGGSFNETNGYVRYERDSDADEYIDRFSFDFRNGDPEMLGTSNRGYGPNLSGTVCRTVGDPTFPDGTPRPSTDRWPRDGVTVSTDTYRWRATGRWMVRDMQVAKPKHPGTYGPDLVDRWKGRAFQQSPDSAISLVGFEDEQVNWEANSALIGEKTGPVRAIRETWGADSGTNVTKTETFYRDAVAYRYRLRVHPIPPDGIYTNWDYNAGVASTYFNMLKPDGVTIDGINDDVGQIDNLQDVVPGAPDFPAFFDVPDPTFNIPSALGTWDQVSGVGEAGSLVYVFENKSPASFTEPAVVPYYRDDKCLDDGTGDDPVARPWPGEAQSHSGLAAYRLLPCDQKQGAWGSHGLHFFFTSDTDNAFVSPAPTTEVDGQQWQFAVPTKRPTNVGQDYANNVLIPLQAVVVESI